MNRSIYWLSLIVALIGVGFYFWNAQTPKTVISQNPSSASTRGGVIFPNTSYDRVVAYHYDGVMGRSIIEKGRLHPHIKDSVALDPTDVQGVLATLNNITTYGGEPTRCFRPRHGLVFYSKGKAIAQVSICFECNHLRSDPPIKAAYAMQSRHAAAYGFSEQGRQALMDLCKTMGFGQCGHPDMPPALTEEDLNAEGDLY